MKSLDGAWKMAIIFDSDLCSADTPDNYEKVVAAGAIDAIVPGNFELDLLRAGSISDPFFGKNLLQMLPYENAHVFYARKFDYSHTPGSGVVPELVFEGLDTICDIYLNNRLIGSTDNMFISHKLTPDNLSEGENEIVVHIRPACLEARGNGASSGKGASSANGASAAKGVSAGNGASAGNGISAGNAALKYNYETLRLRKAPHMFGWDIMPRLVSAGIYRPVYINERPLEHLRQAYIMTDKVDTRGGKASLILFYDVDIGRRPINGYRITVSGRCGKKEINAPGCSGKNELNASEQCGKSEKAISEFYASEPLWFSAGQLSIKLPDAKFWWPKGYGEQNLYDVTVALEKDGKILDSKDLRIGIRTVKLVRTGTTDIFMNGDFHFEINNKRVFVLGTNWVPADAYHSRDAARIPRMMDLLADIGCNAVRCWGGNVYEDQRFYDACDEMGIMVWQDFAMACAVYPADEDFCRVIRNEATQVIRALRQHPSIILWAGDNECDALLPEIGGIVRNPNRNRVTRETLPDTVAFEDPARPYLPSSPYIDEDAYKLPSAFLPENHLWGPRDYYKSDFYKSSLCAFASEMGYHGCPSADSMKKFLSPQALWPWQDNDEWKIHASSPEIDGYGPYIYRIELMAKQIKELFGDIPDTLDDFVLASQISQAEAKKFFIELFRSGQPKRSGIIWWNLIDGWPQFSDAVVDYYFVKKLAYHYIKQSQAPLLLTFTEPRDWRLRLAAINNSGTTLNFVYSVKDYDTGETLLSGPGICDDAQVAELGSLPYSQGEKKFYIIEWECEEEHSGKNHYLAGNPPFDLKRYSAFLKDVYGNYL